MADNHTVRAAREAPIGDQSHCLTVTLTNQSRGDRQHFTHARTTFGAFIANDDGIAMRDLMLHDGLKGLFLRVENPGGTAMAGIFEARYLTHSTLWSQVALEYNQGTCRMKWLFNWHDDFLSLCQVGGVL